jgi:uncharacterized membrane protein
VRPDDRVVPPDDGIVPPDDGAVPSADAVTGRSDAPAASEPGVSRAAGHTADPTEVPTADLDRVIAGLLTIGIYISVALLAVGTVAMLAAGGSPLDAAPEFDLTRLPADLVALHPDAFLWLGLVAVIATPTARVAASLVGYARARERGMVVVSALILVVIASSVLLARVTEG